MCLGQYRQSHFYVVTDLEVSDYRNQYSVFVSNLLFYSTELKQKQCVTDLQVKQEVQSQKK